MRAGGARNSEQGAMAVEFALVFPIVFVVMFGIVQYGIYFWGRSTAAASARESARQLAVGTDWTCSHDQAVGKTNGAGKNGDVRGGASTGGAESHHAGAVESRGVRRR